VGYRGLLYTPDRGDNCRTYYLGKAMNQHAQSAHEFYLGPAISDLKLILMLKTCKYVNVGSFRMDINNRIVYDDKAGTWTVLYHGQKIDKPFKTSQEAMTYLQELKSGKVKV
jgi:hypothetical protein